PDHRHRIKADTLSEEFSTLAVESQARQSHRSVCGSGWRTSFPHGWRSRLRELTYSAAAALPLLRSMRISVSTRYATQSLSLGLASIFANAVQYSVPVPMSSRFFHIPKKPSSRTNTGFLPFPFSERT